MPAAPIDPIRVTIAKGDCGMAKLRAVVSALSGYLDWLVTIGLAAAVSALGLQQNASAQTVSSATLLVLGAFAIASIRDRASARKLKRSIDSLPASVQFALADSKVLDDSRKTGLSRIHPQTVNFNWIPDITAAHTVSIAKLKLNFTEDPEYFFAFEQVLSRGGNVSLVLSDPRSPAMWLRYLEEPRGKANQVGGETAWVLGLEELAVEIARMNSWRCRMLSQGVGPEQLYIGLFPHYPTHAFYRFDDKLYVFHYPYMARGFHAPAYLFNDPRTQTHTFLLRCNKCVIDASVELDDSVAADVAAKHASGALSDLVVDRSEIRVVRRRRSLSA
jgi:hypothetical protein